MWLRPFQGLQGAGCTVPPVSCSMVGVASPFGPHGPILGPDGRPLVQLAGLATALPFQQSQASQAAGLGGIVGPAVGSSSSTWNSPGAYPCPQCGKVYRWRGNLNLHLRQECGKDPQFQCPICPHRSKQKSNLKTHIINIHGPHVLRTVSVGQGTQS